MVYANRIQSLSILAIVANIFFAGHVNAKNQSTEQPNIVVFIADDGGMDYGCYGNRVIQTPNIDALAENGLRMTRAFLTAPQCSPSRTSMLTGRFAHTIGTEDLHHTEMSDTLKTLPGELKKAGYFTGVMLKEHFGTHIAKDFMYHDNGFRPDYVEGKWDEKALGYFREFLEEAGGRPFFMWLGFVDPHRPYKDEVNAALAVHDPSDIKTVPPYLADMEDTKADLAAYYDEIHRMDKRIGEMVTELDKRGMTQNTIIIFISDNGYPFPRGKGSLYDSGIQTPMVIQWKGKIKPGIVYEEMVSTIDLTPTLLDIAGITPAEEFYGRSFKPALFDQTVPGREMIFAERNWHGWDDYIRCIRTKKYKLVYNGYSDLILGAVDGYSSPSWTDLRDLWKSEHLKPGQKQVFEHPRPHIELYDLEKDPYEINNIADRQEHINTTVRTLFSEIAEWQKETLDHPPYKRRLDDKIDRVTGAYYNGESGRGYYED
jgi:N-sulfoglucosamine sulfohydrolase